MMAAYEMVLNEIRRKVELRSLSSVRARSAGMGRLMLLLDNLSGLGKRCVSR
jgi:hypothetical protein